MKVECWCGSFFTMSKKEAAMFKALRSEPIEWICMHGYEGSIKKSKELVK